LSAVSLSAFFVQYRALAQELHAAFPGQLEISGAGGRRSSFEISVMRIDGGEDKQQQPQQQLLFSKLTVGSFPDTQSVRDAVGQFLKDGSVAAITALPKVKCTMFPDD
jgi:hypothetical protein